VVKAGEDREDEPVPLASLRRRISGVVGVEPTDVIVHRVAP
jgi:hypothetical protein